MGFFDLTTEDLASGKAQFKDGDVATMVVSKLVKKEINNKENIIVELVVLDGDNAGLKHSEFFNMTVDGGRKALANFLMAFMPAKDIPNMEDPSVLINRKCVARFSEYKGYVNSKSWKEVSDVPQQVVQQPIIQQPVAQPATVAQQQQQVQASAIVNPMQAKEEGLKLSKGIFN